MQAFQLSYDAWFKPLAVVCGMGPRRVRITVDDRGVRIKCGFWFRTVIPRDRIVSAERATRRVVSRGVHGFWGRWLVNGSSRGLVRLRIEPWVEVRIPISLKLRDLTVSLDDPDGFLASVTSAGSSGLPS